jgi:hypothetical protein
MPAWWVSWWKWRQLSGWPHWRADLIVTDSAAPGGVLDALPDALLDALPVAGAEVRRA